MRRKRRYVLLLLVSCAATGCRRDADTDAVPADAASDSVESVSCPTHLDDSDWVNFGPGRLEDAVRDALGASDSQALMAKIGQPGVSRKEAGDETRIWVYGARRQTRIKECDNAIHESYMVEYHLLSVTSSSADGAIAACRVLRRVYQSATPDPDPLGSEGFLEFYSEDDECADWEKDVRDPTSASGSR
jgi:hypothetical protein